MSILPHLPSGKADYLRILINRRPVTPIANWDVREPLPQPLPDVDLAESQVRQSIAAHVARGSVDGAHASIADRTISSVADQWRDAAHAHYLNQEAALAQLRSQGMQHLAKIGKHLEVQRRETERHQAFAEARWRALTTEDEQPNHQQQAPPHTQSLPELVEHKLLVLPTDRNYHPFHTDQGRDTAERPQAM